MSKRVDPLSQEERSSQMSKVRGKGNRSTELVVAAQLTAWGITGWESHPLGLAGKPDFYFPEAKMAIFTDGCFWHGCPACQRRMPTSHSDFWARKISANRKRDRLITKTLRGDGIHVTRIWEHSLRGQKWRASLRRFLTRLGFPRTTHG